MVRQLQDTNFMLLMPLCLLVVHRDIIAIQRASMDFDPSIITPSDRLKNNTFTSNYTGVFLLKLKS